MSRYNSNYGSHDQLRESRELGMEVMRQRDMAYGRILELEERLLVRDAEIERLTDELYLAHEALRRAFPENQA
jgi:hypothetical protein